MKTNKKLTDLVANLNGTDFDAASSTDCCLLFLLGAATAGSVSARKIAFETGLPHADCKSLSRRAREAGIFRGYKIAGADWLDEESGGIALICDALVLDGKLERTSS